VFADQTRNKHLIAGIADEKQHTLRNCPSKAGRKVVKYDDLLTGIEKLENHMAANIASSASDQHSHPCFALKLVGREQILSR